MPSRILREGILTSERVNVLSPESEVFYRRLMSAVDDYGRYTSHPALLRAALYPLRLDHVGEKEVQRMMADCQRAKLVNVYEAEGKRCLELLNFRQHVRARESKFPAPPDACVADATQPLGTRVASVHLDGDGDVSVCGDAGANRTGSPPEGAAEAPPPTSKVRDKKAPVRTDDEIIAELAAEPAFLNLDVPHVAAKMRAWCRANGKQPTQRRLVNWLNREDKPLKGAPAANGYIPKHKAPNCL